MASRELMGDAIEPGSIPYGEKGPLVSNLPSGAGGASPSSSPAPAGPEPQLAPDIGSALGFLSSGEFPTDPDIPQTAGLPAGPGGGPAAEMQEPQSQFTERLRTIALEAKSPQMRAQARAALKILVKRGAL